jgi:M6 family metalloprotease-like protein
MIDFPDVKGEGTARDRFGEFFPKTAQWYEKSSYGALRYKAEAPVEKWLRMPRPFTAYAVDRGADYDAGYRQLVEDITAAADDRVDFSAYDLVNVLVTPNAGPSALDSVLSVTFAGLPDPPKADGVALGPVSFIYSRQDDGSSTAAQNAYRVLPHENAHGFELPDLYTPEERTEVGHWDIMSEDWGANNDFLAWHKYKLGWLRASQVACAGRSGSSEHALTPLGRPGGTKLVYVPVSERAGYAVEARTQEGNDAVVCRPGVLVYRVNADVPSGKGPIRVVDGKPHSGGCLRQANVNPELTDATFLPGQKMVDRRSGIVIEVMGKDSSGVYRVKITSP